jgi:hypothetical protein
MLNPGIMPLQFVGPWAPPAMAASDTPYLVVPGFKGLTIWQGQKPLPRNVFLECHILGQLLCTVHLNHFPLIGVLKVTPSNADASNRAFSLVTTQSTSLTFSIRGSIPPGTWFRLASCSP